MSGLDHCPKCGGPADNGHDRCIPPNVYWCTKCMTEYFGPDAPKPPVCTHCSHPLYAAIRCSACGRWTDEKERTESALQRLSDFHQEIESNTVEIRRYRKACEMALEALDSHGTGSFPYRRDAAIDALREALSKPEKPE